MPNRCYSRMVALTLQSAPVPSDRCMIRRSNPGRIEFSRPIAPKSWRKTAVFPFLSHIRLSMNRQIVEGRVKAATCHNRQFLEYFGLDRLGPSQGFARKDLSWCRLGRTCVDSAVSFSRFGDSCTAYPMR
jgi:hypothetical protein